MKQQVQVSDTESKGAQFSPCRTWRYALWRHWDWQGHANCVMFIGLNPSTADETQDDPTIRRCIRFAKDWGYGGIYMLNIFAFRATDPRDMKTAIDPVGPGNDEALTYYRSRVGLIIAAWGTHGAFMQRGQKVTELMGHRIDCLGVTKDRHPKHPLYLRADCKPYLYYSPEVV